MTKESSRSTYKIYVGNLSSATTNDDLFKVFSTFGIVVEAIVLDGKGFGFVHMDNEIDGVRAMKSLYKHQLKGKEMVVQTAINPKKASVSPNTQKATFGKGSSTLDDFEDFTEYDAKFLEQHYLNNCSPPSEVAASASNAFSNFPQQQSASIDGNGVNNLAPQLNSSVGLLSKNNSVPNLRPTSVIGTRPITLDNNGSGGAGSGLNNLIGNGFPQKSVQLIPNSINNINSSATLNVNTANLNGIATVSAGVPASWNFPAASLNSPSAVSSHLNNPAVGTPALQQALGSIAAASNSALLKENINNGLNGNGFIPEQLINSHIPSQHHSLGNLVSTPFPSNNSGTIGPVSNSQQQPSVLSQLQQLLLQNPNNTQLAALIAKNSGQDQVEDNYSKAKLYQQALQRQLLDHRQFQLLPQQQQFSNNNGVLNALPNTLGNQHSQLIGSTMAGNPSVTIGNLIAAVTNPMSVVGSTSANAGGLINTNSSVASSVANISSASNATKNSTNFNGSSAVCGLCHEIYNAVDRLPKILGCTHTFCLSCLKRLVGGGVIICPSGCGVPTSLSDAGVSGLTTNQSFLVNIPQQSLDSAAVSLAQNQSKQFMEICAVCTGTKNEQPLSKCKEEGHTFVPAQDAIKVILNQLQPLVKECLVLLGETMNLRASNKERVQSTIRALAKFMDELKLKVERDDSDEAVYNSMLNNLNRILHQVEGQSYAELLRAYHMVETCFKDISAQYNHSVNMSSINDAVKAVTININPKTLNAMSKLGLFQDEVFYMDQSLMDHARVGNYANVLLQYMVCDLLATRVNHNVVQDKEALNTTEKCLVGGMDGLTNAAENADDNLSSIQESRSASSVSPLLLAGNDLNVGSNVNELVSNGVFSLTASSSATPDMNAMTNSADRDPLAPNVIGEVELNCVLQTTEAIEAQSFKPDNGLAPFQDESVSLGLANFMKKVAPGNSVEASNDLESSLLEGSACIDPVPVAVKSSAPSPSGSKSISPPAENSPATVNVESSASSSNSGISCKPFSYLDAAKKPAKPPPEPQPKNEVAKLPAVIKQFKSPHAWMRLAVDGKSIGRVVFQLRPDKAPRMCENFLGLCNGKVGYGYKGTHFFKNGEGFLAGGDVENDNGSGGFSIFNREKFEADLCPLKDEVGMIRFKGNGTSENGRGMVGSQFMVWYAEREFKKFSYSLVFGRVVDGMDVVKKAADINLTKSDVTVEDCGGIV